MMESILTHIPTNPDPDPETLAAEFLQSADNVDFVDVESVLKAARYAMAREIACDPHVRQSLRNTFYDHAKISTYPTPKGIKEIDRDHDFFVQSYSRDAMPQMLCSHQRVCVHPECETS